MSIKKIVEGGYCIGCGLCSDLLEQNTAIKFDKFGQYQLTPLNSQFLNDSDESNALNVCPFSSKGPNEDQIGRIYYEDSRYDSRIGYYEDLYVSHVKNKEQRKKSSSGGIITFVAKQMLIDKQIDYVVHVKKDLSKESKALFTYGISSTIEELENNTKSRYYPVEMSRVIKAIKEKPGKYLVIGLPCFLKGVRRLAAVDPVINERVAFTIGLICGHLKSKSFAELFGFQCGIDPDKIENIDFRVKNETGKAIMYSVLVEGNGKSIKRRWKEFYGAHWGHNFFRYAACDYCDDVFAETADMTVGDAWLDEYVDDSLGNSVVVIRNKKISKLFKLAREKDLLYIDQINADKAAKSQAGGIRDRRAGLAYRLYLKNIKGKWTPQKRVEPSKKNIKFFRRLILKNRMVLRTRSHKFWLRAKEKNDFALFKRKMTFYIYKNSLLYILSNNYTDVVRSVKRFLVK